MINPLKYLGIGICLPIFGILCLVWVAVATPLVWVLEKCGQSVANFPYIF